MGKLSESINLEKFLHIFTYTKINYNESKTQYRDPRNTSYY